MKGIIREVASFNTACPISTALMQGLHWTPPLQPPCSINTTLTCYALKLVLVSTAIKGTWSVHSFNGEYLSIVHTGT